MREKVREDLPTGRVGSCDSGWGFVLPRSALSGGELVSPKKNPPGLSRDGYVSHPASEFLLASPRYMIMISRCPNLYVSRHDSCRGVFRVQSRVLLSFLFLESFPIHARAPPTNARFLGFPHGDKRRGRIDAKPSTRGSLAGCF